MLELRSRRRRPQAEPRKCFACGSHGRIVKSGRRKDGTPWHLCAQCRDAWHADRETRELERFATAFLRGKGALGDLARSGHAARGSG